MAFIATIPVDQASGDVRTLYTAIASDFTTAGLAPADMAVMAFAEKLARDEAGRAKAARPNCA